MSALTDRWARMAQRERAIITVVGLILALAGVLLIVTVVFGGDGGPEAFNERFPTPGPRATSSPTPSGSPAPQTGEVFEGKDPFRPLVIVAEGSPGPGGSPAPSPGPDGGPTSSGGQRVSLLDVRTQQGHLVATVEVNGKDYTVKEGDTFAGSYKVLKLQGKCGTFVFGDERFTLCVGQEVVK